MATLKIVSGQHRGKKIEINGEATRIGRDPENDVVISDTGISRHHATIDFHKDGRFRIHDLDSTNGTFLFDNQVHTAELFDNAHLRFAHVDALFQLNGMSRQPTDANLIEQATGSVFGAKMAISEAGMAYATEDPSTSLVASHLHTAYRVSEIVSGNFASDEEMYERILAAVFAVLKAQNACVLLKNRQAVLENKRSKDIHGSCVDVPFSNTVAQKVADEGVSLLLDNAQESEEFRHSKSVSMGTIRSVVCVPVQYRGEIIGVLYADARGIGSFGSDDLQLMRFIGRQAGLAIKNSRLVAQNVNSERLATVGKTVANLAHGIKNALQGFEGAASIIDLALHQENLAKISSTWPVLKLGQQRISELILNLLDFSSNRRPVFEWVELTPLIDELLALVAERVKLKHAKIRLAVDRHARKIECDAGAVHCAILNLLTNAIQALPESGGEIEILVVPHEKSKRVAIIVKDNGAGISPIIRHDLFTPFATTKGSRGTGLGLAVTKKIVAEHDGDIFVESQPGKGTKVTLVLPEEQAGGFDDTSQLLEP